MRAGSLLKVRPVLFASRMLGGSRLLLRAVDGVRGGTDNDGTDPAGEHPLRSVAS
jgi:hypothetical protein